MKYIPVCVPDGNGQDQNHLQPQLTSPRLFGGLKVPNNLTSKTIFRSVSDASLFKQAYLADSRLKRHTHSIMDKSLVLSILII